MLKNLIKYEFKATGRIMGLLYAALVVTAVICRVTMGLTGFGKGMTAETPSILSNIISAIILFLYGMVICAVVVVTLVMILLRFYRNLLQNEGYLMNTLPVKSRQHIMSKLIAAVVWTVVSVAVVVISLIIVSTLAADFSGSVPGMLRQLWNITGGVFTEMGLKGVYLLVMTVLVFLLTLTSSILQMYAALSIGQTQDRYKIAVSFAAYIGISVVFQLISSGAAVLLRNAISTADLNSLNVMGNIMYISITGVAAALLIKSAVLFVVTDYFLKNRLNLE